MQRAKYLYLSVIILCLVIISGCIYYVLGGFDPVEVYLFDGPAERTVIGKEYFLPANDNSKEYNERMTEAWQDIQNGTLKGQLTSVIYVNDTLSKDSIHCFIGASFEEIKGVMRMPSGYEYRQFTTNRIYKIFVTQHALARPTPEENEQLMQVRSIEEGEVLQPYTFELYYEDNSLSIEKWVK